MKLNHALEESSSWSSLLDALKLVRSIEVHTGSRIRDAVILFLCVIATASGGCAAAPITSQTAAAGQEVLVLEEYGILSFVSPNGGTLQDVPLKHYVGSPYGLNSRPTLRVSTRNEEGIIVLQELTQDGTVLKEYPFPSELEFIYAFSVSPTGERVLFYYKHKQVHGIRADSLNGGESRVVFEPIDTIGLKDLQWSPDEKLFAFTRQARPPLGLKQWVFEVNVVDLANSHHVAVSTSPITNTMLPAFSPDGRYLAYFERVREEPKGEWVLYVHDLSQLHQPGSRSKVASVVPRQRSTLYQLQWSPDGHWLSWMEYHDEPFPRFYRIRLDGTDLQEIVIHRPWWRRIWRSIWPLEPAHRCCFSYYWWKPPSPS